MKEEMEQLVSAGKIQPKHVTPLVALVEAGYCQHKSWGFGKIKTVDGIAGRLVVDFPGKTGHTLDLEFAADSLKAIPKNHILARKHADLKGVQQMAALHHLDVVKMVVMSFGGRATVDQIQGVLVPDVIQSDWKKWWEAARTELKKDGHFQVPLKKADPVIYQALEQPLAQRLSIEFKTAKGLKARVTVAGEMVKSIADMSDASVADDAVTTLNADIASHVNTMQPLALEGIFMRDDLRTAAGITPIEGEIPATSVWSQGPRLKDLFEEIPAAKHRRVLESFKASVPDWAVQLVMLFNNVPAKLVGECAKLLLQEGKGQLLKDTLTRLISQHGASTELLLWFSKERNDYFAELLTPEVFRAMLTAMERDQFNERKTNRLRDNILADQQLIPDLIKSADLEVIKDMTRALQLSPSFDDMDKRSLLARIVKQYPAIQTMITGDQKKEDNVILVSWSSLERRKAEYDELVSKAIPANVKDIALARSYGDLRENHEYKSAKEQQKVLQRRKAELEQQMGRARGTDFSSPRTDVVGPGVVVTITDIGSGKREIYELRGAWDGEPEKNILSYLTPLAQALVNKTVGTEVEFTNEGAIRKLRIEAITVPSA
jgi:hypothetical protein